jgi:hypothetical protein
MFTFAPSCNKDVCSGIWGLAIPKIFYGARENFSWRSRKIGTKEQVLRTRKDFYTLKT